MSKKESEHYLTETNEPKKVTSDDKQSGRILF